MLRILIAITLAFSALGGIAQNKELRHNTALEQVRDFRNGILLIPLLDEPKSEGISQNRDPEFMRIRESNSALIAAVSQRFGFSDIAFFWESNLELIRNEDTWTDHIMNKSYRPLTTKHNRGQVFIVTFFEENFKPKEEIIVKNKKVERRKEKKRLQDMQSRVKTEERIASNLTKFRAQLSEGGEAMSTKKREKIQRQIDYYENYWEPSEFEKAYFYYLSTSTAFGGLLVNRLEAKTVVRNEKRSYVINYNYITRVHKEVNYIDQYKEAFEHLEILLENKLLKLEGNVGED